METDEITAFEAYRNPYKHKIQRKRETERRRQFKALYFLLFCWLNFRSRIILHTVRLGTSTAFSPESVRLTRFPFFVQTYYLARLTYFHTLKLA